MLTPGFLLAGGLLAAIPLVIHFLNRRRFREQSWAAMSFLLAAMKKNRRRLRFEQWLLLAVRCLVLALLGLALARPVGCGGEGALSGLARQSGLQVLVIDDSYSMGYEGRAGSGGGVETHFERAKAVAGAVITGLVTGGDAVAVVTASRPARVLVAPTFDLEAARGAVERLELSSMPTDVVGALRAATELGRSGVGGGAAVRVLRVLSDGTRASLVSGAGEGGRGEGGELGQAVREASGAFTRVVYHHLGVSDQRSGAVLSLDVGGAAGTGGGVVTVRGLGSGQTLRAEARGFGAGAGEGLGRVVQWRVDEAVLPAGGGDVRLTEAGEVLTATQVRFASAGMRVAEVRLVGEDRLAVDTVRWRVVEALEGVRVLLVEGERGAGPLGSSGAFLRLAMSPELGAGGAGGGGMSPLDVEVVSDLELGSRPMGEYRVIVLAGVGQVSEAVADQLRRFVEGGGVLVVFAGEGVSMEGYNRVLVPRGLVPGPLVRRMTAADGGAFTFDFSPTGNLHPMLSVLRGEERSGLDTAQVYVYLQMELGGEGGVNAERVLSFAGEGVGDPAITTHGLGVGRVVFVATSAGADGWTSLPGKPVFVTLVQEMISRSLPPRGGWLNLTVGDRLEVRAGGGGVGGEEGVRLVGVPTLTDPRGQLVAMSAEGESGVWRSEVLRRAGVYRLSGVAVSGGEETGSGAGGGGGGVPVAVNVDAAAEGDVRTMDRGAVGAVLMAGGGRVEVVGDELPAEGLAEADRGADWGWAVLAAVLGLVVLESVLAMRFGHYRG